MEKVIEGVRLAVICKTGQYCRAFCEAVGLAENKLRLQQL